MGSRASVSTGEKLGVLELKHVPKSPDPSTKTLVAAIQALSDNQQRIVEAWQDLLERVEALEAVANDFEDGGVR